LVEHDTANKAQNEVAAMSMRFLVFILFYSLVCFLGDKDNKKGIKNNDIQKNIVTLQAK
jgi:hypothetical protein